MSEEEIRKIEARWKSDVDVKLDKLLSFHEEYGPLLLKLAARESRYEALQKAVIEKTLAGLIWMGIAGTAALIWSGIKVELNEFIAYFRGGK